MNKKQKNDLKISASAMVVFTIVTVLVAWANLLTYVNLTSIVVMTALLATLCMQLNLITRLKALNYDIEDLKDGLDKR